MRVFPRTSRFAGDDAIRPSVPSWPTMPVFGWQMNEVSEILEWGDAFGSRSAVFGTPYGPQWDSKKNMWRLDVEAYAKASNLTLARPFSIVCVVSMDFVSPGSSNVLFSTDNNLMHIRATLLDGKMIVAAPYGRVLGQCNFNAATPVVLTFVFGENGEVAYFVGDSLVGVASNCGTMPLNASEFYIGCDRFPCIYEDFSDQTPGYPPPNEWTLSSGASVSGEQLLFSGSGLQYALWERLAAQISGAVYAEFTPWQLMDGEFGLCARYANSGNNFYFAGISNNTVTIKKRVSGSYETLESQGHDLSFDGTLCATFDCTRSGSPLTNVLEFTIWEKNRGPSNAEKIGASDNSLGSSPGKFGIMRLSDLGKSVVVDEVRGVTKTLRPSFMGFIKGLWIFGSAIRPSDYLTKIKYDAAKRGLIID